MASIMKNTAFITIISLIISLGSFAQKEGFDYQPRLFQTSIRMGFINSSMNLEYRINPKTMASADFGLGLVHLQSHYYDRFNNNYDGYDTHYDNFLNFGREWWSPYSSIQIRRIFDNRSRIKYDSAPYANTFTYYGIQLKYNGREWKQLKNDNKISSFRETYQFAAMFGRQVELSKKGNSLCDWYIGIGGTSNYKLTMVEPKFLIGARLGINFWRRNK